MRSGDLKSIISSTYCMRISSETLGGFKQSATVGTDKLGPLLYASETVL